MAVAQSLSQLPSLTQEQRTLLLKALRANSGANIDAATGNAPNAGSIDSFSSFRPQEFQQSLAATDGVDPAIFESPVKTTSFDNHSPPTFGDSLFPDFTNSGSSFDVDIPKSGYDVIDGIAQSIEANEYHEKRKSPEDQDDEEHEEKRQEGEDKTPKKPGRKPLTSEPTTKRKAQNRAAQRAFRERKEKHLKDLEQKVVDLEKASQSASQENGLLRAQITRLQSELQNYRKRMSQNVGHVSPPNSFSYSSTSSSVPNGTNGSGSFDNSWNLPDNFFEPTMLSMQKAVTARSMSDSVKSQSQSPAQNIDGYFSSPQNRQSVSLSPTNTNGYDQGNTLQQNSTVNPSYGDILTPSFWSTFSGESSGFANISRTEEPKPMNGYKSSSVSTASNSASPFTSAESNIGHSSSCGTSPEPSAKSPPYVKQDGPVTTTSQNFDSNGLPSFDWLANQNGGQFDPVLFGDYRESQDAIVGGGDFSGGLYDDYFGAAELSLDFNQPSEQTSKPSPMTAKQSLMDKVAQTRDGDGEEKKFILDSDKKNMMTCHKIWEQLKECPHFQAGELDIDQLCSDMAKKAKCSESGMGMEVPKEAWESALWRLVQQPLGQQNQAQVKQLGLADPGSKV